MRNSRRATQVQTQLQTQNITPIPATNNSNSSNRARSANTWFISCKIPKLPSGRSILALFILILLAFAGVAQGNRLSERSLNSSVVPRRQMRTYRDTIKYMNSVAERYGHDSSVSMEDVKSSVHAAMAIPREIREKQDEILDSGVAYSTNEVFNTQRKMIANRLSSVRVPKFKQDADALHQITAAIADGTLLTRNVVNKASFIISELLMAQNEILYCRSTTQWMSPEQQVGIEYGKAMFLMNGKKIQNNNRVISVGDHKVNWSNPAEAYCGASEQLMSLAEFRRSRISPNGTVDVKFNEVKVHNKSGDYIGIAIQDDHDLKDSDMAQLRNALNMYGFQDLVIYKFRAKKTGTAFRNAVEFERYGNNNNNNHAKVMGALGELTA
jgi:hypothetical protein